MKIYLLSILTVLNATLLFGKILSYPVPEEITTSKQYKVELIQNGDTINCPVPSINAKWKTNNCKTTAWASFAFTQKVKVRITAINQKVEFCNILPSSKNIQASIINNIVEFELDKPGQFSVEFQRGRIIDHPLLIFADNLKNDLPSKTSDDVIYFEPGLHNIGERFELKSNQTVYLAPGAYVKGQFFAENQKNIKIIGQGILSGEEYAARSHSHMINLLNCDNVLVEGITIIEAPRFNVVLRGKNHTVRNVKMMGWWFSTDGVITGNESLIENCFFKVNDDAIKLYHSNTRARNCVIWQMENGAPFQISWNMGSDNSGFYVNNMDIIRVEHEWDNPNEAVFCAIHGSKGHMSDYVFENIRIENSTWRVFHIITRPNRFARWDEEQGNVSDIVFRNINVNGYQKIPSLIKGHDVKHKVYNIIFENVVINGQKLDGEKPEEIYIDKKTTENIQFL